MKYTYNEITDKSIDGVCKELGRGLGVISFYFLSVHGMPLEMFTDLLEKTCPSGSDKMFFYLKFRNIHPQLFL